MIELINAIPWEDGSSYKGRRRMYLVDTKDVFDFVGDFVHRFPREDGWSEWMDGSHSVGISNRRCVHGVAQILISFK